MKLSTKVAILITAILVIDQAVKIIIKTNMSIGQEIPVFGQWFRIHFLENNGMAFGYEFGGQIGKIALTIFRILAVIGLLFFIRSLIKKDAPAGFILALGVITAGAAGNIFDSLFYGMIFSDSGYINHMVAGSGVATLFPEGGGYGHFLQGHVVDWIYFPIIHGQYPDWIPFKGGHSFLFFRPVFNIADSAITIGVSWIILFQRKYLRTI